MKYKNLIAGLCFCLFSLNGQVQAQTDAVIRDLDNRLKSGETNISSILANPSLMPYHSQTPFRELIRKYARDSRVTMVTDQEPGTRIVVSGTTLDHNGQPVKNALVYAYQTSSRGWYADTAAHILTYEGDMRHARLFAYFRTDDSGQFTLNTIMPVGYPRTDLPAHIHIHFWDESGEPLNGPAELLFVEDPRLTPERRKIAEQSGFLIEKNSGTETKPLYQYRIILK